VAGYDLHLKIDKGFGEPAKAFFDFLREAGRRHPVTLSVRTVKEGEYHATFGRIGPLARVTKFKSPSIGMGPGQESVRPHQVGKP